MAYVWENNVGTTLAAALAAGATSVKINTATAPAENPPAPGSGNVGILTLQDSLDAPSKRELISYIGRTDNGDGTYTLTGLTRGIEGTGDQDWSTGAPIFMGATAAQLANFEAHRNDITGDPHPQYTTPSEAAAAAPVQSVDGQTGDVDLSGNYEPKLKHNTTATTDPTVNDDSSAGYAPRSSWINTASGEIFRCLDATAGAAVWAQTSLTLDDLGSMATQDAGSVAITGGSIANVPGVRNKNAIVDPGFLFWDEGTSFTGLTSDVYTATMWKIGISNSGTWSVTRVADPSDNQNYGLRAEVITSDGTVDPGNFVLIEEVVEGYRYHRLYGKAQTLAIRLKAGVAGTYGVHIRNKGVDRSHVSELVISAEEVGVEVTKYVTITTAPSGGTWDFTDSIGARIGITLVSSSSYQTTPDAWQSGNYIATANQTNLAATVGNYIELYEVQLEEGTEFTGWERRSYDEELPLVQRYYEQYDSNDDTTLRGALVWTGYAVDGTTGQANHWFRVVKRDSPSVSATNRSNSSNFTSTPSVGANKWGISDSRVSTATGTNSFFSTYWKADARL